MRLLWIATKVPVPPVDGGRLVQKLTLEALATEGLEVELVSPLFEGEDRAAAESLLAGCGVSHHLVPVAARRPVATALAARPGGLPLAIARHGHWDLRRRAAELLAGGRFDLVHVEQLHALPQAAPAARHGVPVVLRAQNVESDLWAAGAERLAPPWRWVARREAHRLARWEGRAAAGVARTVALTRSDAMRLEELMPPPSGSRPGATVEVIAAPFPAVLPAAGRLPGSPAVVMLASGEWPPNRDARHFMVDEVWPEVRKRSPGAVLHLFGGAGEAPQGVVHHPPPADSGEAFAVGSIFVVPLRLASGVRMKILEAWARGVAVVASPQAAAGLEAEDGRELLLADDGAAFAAAVARLATESTLARHLAAAGRAALAARHEPRRVAGRLIEVYRQAMSSADRSRDGGRRRSPRGKISAP